MNELLAQDPFEQSTALFSNLLSEQVKELSQDTALNLNVLPMQLELPWHVAVLVVNALLAQASKLQIAVLLEKVAPPQAEEPEQVAVLAVNELSLAHDPPAPSQSTVQASNELEGQAPSRHETTLAVKADDWHAVLLVQVTSHAEVQAGPCARLVFRTRERRSRAALTLLLPSIILMEDLQCENRLALQFEYGVRKSHKIYGFQLLWSKSPSQTVVVSAAVVEQDALVIYGIHTQSE